MADVKITSLAVLTAADPINDAIPIVDVSDVTMAASGTTKRISVNNILGASGTATLASATITGDLTVDTNVLKVDTTNNAVGINVTPNAALSLTINGEIGMLANSLFYWNGYYSAGFKARAAGYSSNIYSNATGDFIISNTSTSAASAGSAITFRERYRITNSGVFTWEEVGNVAGTAMTLNSTGLGVGVASASIAAKLHVKGVASQNPLILDTLGYNQIVLQLNGAARGQIYADATNCFAVVDAANANTRFVVTDTGNVGVGVSTFGTSAAKVLGLANATAPSTSPAGMGQLYVESGALKFRGSSGTITTIAAA